MDILCDGLETENSSLEMNVDNVNKIIPIVLISQPKTILNVILKMMVQLTDNNFPCRQHQRHTYSVCSFI